MIPVTIKALKEAHGKALKQGKKIFYIGSMGLVTDYAKYLIEYAETVLRLKGDDIITLTSTGAKTTEKN